jgi:FlaA1/EpsC-like NDP-sugar epimerase
MLTQFRNPHFYFIVITDICLICISLVVAYMIRFEFALVRVHLEQILKLLPMMVLVKVLFLFYFKVYKGMFRYASLSDLLKLSKALVSASVVIVCLVLFLLQFQGFSRAVFVLDGVVTFLFLGGFRLLIRIAYQRMETRFSKTSSTLNPLLPAKYDPTFIIGAGSTGEKILREIHGNPRLQFKIIGFLDDDIHKLKRSIHDIPILGKIDDLPRLSKKYEVKQALIAAPSASGKQIRHMVDICKQAKVQFKTLPGFAELIDGKVSIKELRDVNYRDLLRREPVKLDIPEIRQYLMNKRVMITGAGGSIGSELCRQITRFQPESLILFDASEPNLYSIEMEMRHRVGYLKYSTVLGCMQDKNLVDRVLKRYRPHVIFHAAAYKHVPMLERNPWQAVINNVLGSKVIMEQAVRNKVRNFVMVSTDKAVRPTNVMGASKRICELLINAFMGNGTKMMTVRFGNVVNSAGSVVPLFREQIERGGPLTITHPEVTRFFMTIPEASQLVLQSAVLGKGGEIFILDMGTPIKIADMARDLIRLSGKEPDEDIEIVFTGLREGEKLYEELITEGEGIVSTSHEKIMVLKSQDYWNGKTDQEQYRQWLFDRIMELEKSAWKYDGCAIRLKMKEIVPEYDLQDSECIL